MLRQFINLPRTVHLLCLGTFINRAGTLIIPFMTTYMHRSLGVDEGFAPMALGVFGCGSICGQIGGGHLADRFGRRIVMLTALLGGAGILLVLSQVTHAVAFLAGIFVFAAVGESYRPAAQAMIADVTAPEERPHAYSLMYISINLGFAIGPVIGGMVAEYSIRWLFLGDAFTETIYGLIILLGVRETLRRRAPASVTSAGADADCEVAGSAVEAAAGDAPSFVATLKHMLGNGTFLILCAGAFCFALVFMQIMSTFPLFLAERGFGPAKYGRIVSFNGLLIVLGQVPLTNWIRGKPRGYLLVAAALLVGLGFGLHAVAYTELAFIGAVMIWTLGEMMQFPLLPPIVAELAPERMRARYMGVFGLCFSGANMIGAPIGGLVLKNFGGTALWLGGAGLGLVSAALYMTIARRVSQPLSSSPQK